MKTSLAKLSNHSETLAFLCIIHLGHCISRVLWVIAQSLVGLLSCRLSFGGQWVSHVCCAGQTRKAGGALESGIHTNKVIPTHSNEYERTHSPPKQVLFMMEGAQADGEAGWYDK